MVAETAKVVAASEPLLNEDEIGQALQLSPGDNKIKRRAVLTYEALDQRTRALAVLETVTPEMLHELDRQPDLADFRQDPRFQQLVTQTEKRR